MRNALATNPKTVLLGDFNITPSSLDVHDPKRWNGKIHCSDIERLMLQKLMSDRIIMMSNGPAAKVGEILDIDLERPRERVALAKSDQFNYYRQQVLSFLYEKKGVVNFDQAKKKLSTAAETDTQEKSA